MTMCDEQETMTDAEFLAAVKQMGDAGKRQGTSDAAWLCDGNTTRETAQALLAHCEGCSLDVPTPFLGEGGDETADTTISEVTGIIPDSLTDDERDVLLRIFEDEYGDAYCAEAERLTRFYAAD
jgi:hypothetical protein